MIPKYTDMYGEFLNILSDGNIHSVEEIRDKLAAKFNVTEDERKQLTPSGNGLLFNNRVGWTISYLKKAGLVNSPDKGKYEITSLGKETLKKGTVIDNDYLNSFKSFREFLKRNNKPKNKENNAYLQDSQTQTPEEIMDAAFEHIKDNLAEEVLAEVVKMEPFAFERLVINLLIAMGYGNSLSENGYVTKKTGDEGIDGIIKEDKLGFDNIYIQAKCWKPENSVSRTEIQKFAGALAGQKAVKGLFITTSKFTKEAIAYVNSLGNNAKIVLIDGTQLSMLMIEHNIGVSIVNTYVIRRLDSDYFSNI